MDYREPMAAGTPAAIAAAARRMGHRQVFRDETVALSPAEHWTCRDCGRSVLRLGGSIYGLATTEQCPGPPEPASTQLDIFTTEGGQPGDTGSENEPAGQPACPRR